ncbi:MAG TPA: hypothetical protein VNP36_04345 [Burkholderiales bacterium]|nr:hypothetical protein [Burkholderiales bacterium]
MRLLWLALAFLLSLPVAGEEQPEKKKPVAKKQAGPKKGAAAASKKGSAPKAHAQATPEQIRKFNELQKKQQQQKAKP